MALSVVLIFIIINFLIIFKVKSRTTTIISLIISHLVLVLFLALSIANYNSFKEIVLALVVYSMVVLFLVSNYNPAFLEDSKQYKAPLIKDWRLRFVLIFFGGFFVTMVFLASFVLVKNIAKISATVNEAKIERQAQAMENPMILPSHPVHTVVRKFYLEKKFTNKDEWSDGAGFEQEINDKKQARLKDKLSDNFLLKRSSDVILIIVAVSSGILLLSKKKSS